MNCDSRRTSVDTAVSEAYVLGDGLELTVPTRTKQAAFVLW